MDYSTEPIIINYDTKEYEDAELIFSALNMPLISNIINQYSRIKLRNTTLPSSMSYSYESRTVNFKAFTEDYLGEKLSDEYEHIEHLSSLLKIEDLTIPIGVDLIKKQEMLFTEILNQVFSSLPKSYKNNMYNVKLPLDYREVFYYFLNNRIYFESLNEDKELYSVINHYFRMIFNKRLYPISFESLFLENKNYDNIMNFNKDDFVLEFDFNRFSEAVNQNSRELPMSFIKELYNIHEFLQTAELIKIYLSKRKQRDLSLEKETFLTYVRYRQVQTNKVKHKGAREEALKNGFKYLFLPFDEMSFPIGIPLSIKTNIDSKRKTSTEWQILPPTDNYMHIEEYVGSGIKGPLKGLGTSLEPHIVGEELYKVSLAPEFYHLLYEEYQFEGREMLGETLRLIEKYPRLNNELRQLAKEDVHDNG